MPPRFADPSDTSTPLHLLDAAGLDGWRETASAANARWAEASGFTARLGSVCVLQNGGTPIAALVGLGTPEDRARRRDGALACVTALPRGTYHIAQAPEGFDVRGFCRDWLLALYRFDRYADAPAPGATLVAPDDIDRERVEALVAGEALTRDLINTPTSDMGPAELEGAARALAREFGAVIEVTTGDALLDANFPMIHAVGRASASAPRLIDLRWGDSGPTVTLVGKGVCFDTGGLNLKPGASMGLMKKDMGGAAHVLGLARMLMATGAEVRLRVLIPAVENAVAGNAFRPQDILTSRAGLTVEINNTDAEGRLVLADALTLACEDPPDLLISMATLTGAARVAVGPDIAPYFAQADGDAEALDAAGAAQGDPVWRLPFHDAYEAMIEPGIADLDNAPKGGFAGAITAALFLRRFTDGHPHYLHFDVYGWNPTARPACPKGGAAQGLRALYAALPSLAQR
ncbi:MAG: leucyl aminopeptidase family protein [Shimia sp.]